MEATIDAIKKEARSVVQDRDSQLKALNTELSNRVNVQYVRNILVNFMTNPDHTVREKLIPVLATVLQFSQTQTAAVKNAWLYDQKSLIGKQVSNVKLLPLFLPLIICYASGFHPSRQMVVKALQNDSNNAALY